MCLGAGTDLQEYPTRGGWHCESPWYASEVRYIWRSTSMLSLSASVCSSAVLEGSPHTCCSLRPLTGLGAFGLVPVQGARIIIACVEQKNGWFGLWWEWTQVPSLSGMSAIRPWAGCWVPAVDGVASVWAGVLGRRPDLGAAARCAL